MHRQHFLILAFITIALSVGFFQIAVPVCLQYRAGCLGYPVNPPLPLSAPGKYRVLWPALETLIAPTIGQSDPQILLMDTLLMFVCISLTIPALFMWLKQWTEPDGALLGVTLFGAVYLVAFHWFFRGGGIPVEIALVCWSLVFVRRRWWQLAPLLVIGAFNRETSAVIVGIYAAYHGRGKWREVVALGVIWGGITLALHIILGGAEHQVGGVSGTWIYNISTLPDGIMSNLLLLPLAVIVAMGYRDTPPILKRFVWVACIYMAVVIVMGAWAESNRLLLPVLPITMPVLLYPNLRERKQVVA